MLHFQILLKKSIGIIFFKLRYVEDMIQMTHSLVSWIDFIELIEPYLIIGEYMTLLK